jgi:hypothetical protein
MPTDPTDLWPAEITVDVLSPLMILNEQAATLAKRTQGIVKGEVVSGTAGDLQQLSFDLRAPAIGFRHRLLECRYAKDHPYPIVVLAQALIFSGSQGQQKQSLNEQYADPALWKLSESEQWIARVGHTPAQTREILRVIFNSSKTLAILLSMIARTNEARDGQAEELSTTLK